MIKYVLTNRKPFFDKKKYTLIRLSKTKNFLDMLKILKPQLYDCIFFFKYPFSKKKKTIKYNLLLPILIFKYIFTCFLSD